MMAKRLFTRAEYHRMGEVGIFSEDDRVELIKGEIVKIPWCSRTTRSPSPT